ncbi:hypothetical protein [Sphingobium sp. MK2]|uniref:hypothetical protein n=1 Tax=Sphingobium sp. MK2 TaxID=3116540 RepID=UPI0032E35E47
MSNLIRKIAKKKRAAALKGPGMGKSGTAKARIIMKLHPETGEMREFHLTKGWR